MNQKVFVTDNFVLAIAMVAAGFGLKSVENFINKKGDGRGILCELDSEHNGIDANELLQADLGVINLADRVNEILKARGITKEEYVLIAFDAARAGLISRSRVVAATRQNKPLIAKELSDGRNLVYREGVPKEQLRKLVENA